MKMLNTLIQLIILSLTFSIVSGQGQIPFINTDYIPTQTDKFEQSIQTSNRFNMNQSFSLSTSMSGNMSQTAGIYSNFTSYQLSKKLNFTTGLHLIQNQNNLTLSSGPEIGMGYEMGFEYQFNPNSKLSFQLSNYSNSPILYQSFPYLNVP